MVEAKLNADRGSNDQEGYEEVLQELEKQQNKQKSWVNNLIILLVSIVIFFQLGLLKGGVWDVFLIIVVLLVHEMGHFLGMRFFGYRNVQMFFIPFFGAAVSGESRNVPGYKKALVALLGPVPGILIGTILAILSITTRTKWYLDLSLMFVFINGFNLLPIFPLDGGRLLQEVLFSRNPYVELLSRIIASAILILIGFWGGMWFLGVLGLFGLLTVGIPFKVARISRSVLRQLATQQENIIPEEQIEPVPPDSIPLRTARLIIRNLYESISAKLKVKDVASYTRQIWERIQIQPPSVGATIGLLVLYIFCFLFPFIGAIIIVGIEHAQDVPLEIKIVEFEKPDGQIGLKEETFKLETLKSTRELSVDGRLYHGKEILYNFYGNVSCEGNWSEGYKDGKWEYYNYLGELEQVLVYKNGTLISFRQRQGDKWIEKGLDDLPEILKDMYLDEDIGPSGPKSSDITRDANDISNIILDK